MLIFLAIVLDGEDALPANKTVLRIVSQGLEDR